ncbi:DUF4124 domain-containing protein [Variovorax sp. 770b2]|jgi:hypothetical protein|uniref:DUF4124 domain-containing protein n=1 Tax=Variovorax sp. 770b2 TaxID=1566271 RepID=UPI0008F347A1|nr:DUF4124 domain-containing protein [Variovorax sp. 770b2]SFQ18692.1 protein of unknown function [Variovorax sp. 770b2]
MRTRDHGKPNRLLAVASFSFLTAILFSGAVHAQKDAPAGGIYTCTDARGRTLTADRPIADCSDREQRELSPSGLTRRKIEPTYSAREMAEREDRAREAAVQAAKATDERRRERALLVRYPSAASHDRERDQALSQVDAVIQAAQKRIAELGEDRKKIDEELEFYKKDTSKAPGAMRRKLEDNAQSVAVQNRFIAEQEEEKKRVNARFDEERARLKPLWGPAPSTAAAAPR